MFPHVKKWVVPITIVALILLSLILFWVRRENYCDSMGPVPTYSFYDGYSGLADPAGMLKYNDAYLRAQEAGCGDCIDAAQICMENPYSKECQHKVNKCQDTCSNPGVLDAIKDGQKLVADKDWENHGRCWYSKRGIGPDPSIPDPNIFL